MFRLVPGSKKFSIPSNDYAGNPPGPEHINHTIIHEMMHIIFEDFYKKHFDKDILPLRKYYDFLEIMNFIVLSIPQIKKHAVKYRLQIKHESIRVLKKYNAPLNLAFNNSNNGSDLSLKNPPYRRRLNKHINQLNT